MNRIITKLTRYILILLGGLHVSLGLALADGEIPSYEPWDKEIVEAFKSLPIQQGGRIKPMQAYAQVKLLRYNAKRSMKLAVGKPGSSRTVKITATEWLLDVMFRPELARKFPVFIVNDSDAIIDIGVEEHAKRRSRYSHDEIFRPAAGPEDNPRNKLSDKSKKYSKIDESDRTGKQNQIVHLAGNIGEFEYINHLFDFAREGVSINLPDVSADLVGEHLPVSVFLRNVAAIRKASQDPSKIEGLGEALDMANRQLGLYLETARLFGFTPPRGASATWLLPSDLMEAGISGGVVGAEKIAFELGSLERLEALGSAEPNSREFKEALAALSKSTARAMEPRGEGKRIGVELLLYKGKFAGNVQACLLLGFLLMMGALLAGQSRIALWLRRLGVTFGIFALLLLATWLTLRCVVMQRPPVANLYETVIFIVTIVLLLSVVFHFFTRRPIVLPAALLACSFGVFLSMLYDGMKGEDTMDPLVAVLNSNFWLATHVTIVTMGYAAGLLAAIIAHVYIFAKIFGCRDRELLRDITRMVYAVMCFTLLFSLVGTILGGIWANVSWGRFWGWDPKENGALLIVLATLAILHARMGGHIRQDGVHLCAVVLGMIVAFSWWYVNVMGVGLHSYGFTSGIKRAVWKFWKIELVVLVIGFVSRKWCWNSWRGLGRASSEP
jgi:ABC-type transport system involved in cytochrome c biogenesis permease subunit